MKLVAGQRFRLTDENKFVFIKSGFAEAYAMTRDIKSFRQLFLMELFTNDAAYPSMDELEQIDVVIYAVEDTEIELVDLKEVPPLYQVNLMRRWFSELIKLSWLRLMADRGDEMLIRWRNGDIFSGIENSKDELYKEFLANEQIFAMMLGVQFIAEDKRLEQRLETRLKHQRLLIDNAISNLMDEREIIYESGTTSKKNLEEAIFIIRVIANALSMPTENIQIAPEFVKRLDQVGLIRRLMQKGNMQMRFITLEPNWYKKDSGVIIGWYGEKKELAAFVPVSTTQYKLFTIKNPRGIDIVDEVAANIHNRGFICYAGLPAKKLNVKDLVIFIAKHIWKTDYRAILVASFIAGLVAMVSPIVTETIFNDIIPILDREGLVTVTQVAIVASFTTAIVSMVRAISMMRIMTHVDMSIESALLGRLFALPTTFFRKFQSGEIAQRLMGIMNIKAVFSGQIISTVFNFVFSFWSIFLMCYYSLKLTVAAIFLWIVYCIFMAFIYRRIVNFERNMINAKNKTAGLIQQIFTGLAKFRIQGAEEQAFNLWSKLFGEEWKWNLQLRWLSNYSSIMTSIQPLIITMILYFLVTNDMKEALEQGKDPTKTVISYAQFIAFQTAFTGFNLTINSMIPTIAQFFKLRPSIENLQPILDEIPEAAEEKIDADVLSGSISVENLSFSYGEGENTSYVLHDLSFRISAGENVAIVGRSGCGKSTLIRLLLGFEKPNKGSILYDDQDLSELNLSSVRSQMGVVLQNGQLMSGDIFTNIVGTAALTMDDAWKAAEAAGIADDIRKMPMGMQTVIGEGSSNISGGQRQRILIARALAAKPSIIIFDEATSALDNRTQAIVTESLNKLNTTRIVVAHRLSTIKECDRIIVFDKGHIAESGTFNELVAKNGIFAELVKRQTA